MSKLLLHHCLPDHQTLGFQLFFTDIFLYDNYS